MKTESNISRPAITCISNASPKPSIPDDVLSVIEQYQKNKSTIRNSGKNFILSEGDKSKRDNNKPTN